jgi:hypothetical protein
VAEPRDPVAAPGDPPPEEVPALGARDLSRRRDRQAAVVLVVAAAVSTAILLPLGLAIGLIATAYAYLSGARLAAWIALAIVCVGLLSVILGLTDFDGGAFQG